MGDGNSQDGQLLAIQLVAAVVVGLNVAVAVGHQVDCWSRPDSGTARKTAAG